MNDYIAEKILSDGRLGVVFPLTFGRARLGIGPADSPRFEQVF